METVQEVLNLKKLQYEWCIKNIHDYFDFIDEHESLTLTSKEFRVKNSINHRFFLKISIGMRSISCSVHRYQNTEFTKLICRLSFINGNNKVLKTVISKMGYATHIKRVPENLATLVLSSNELLKKRTDLFPLFPVPELKVVCELTILDGSVEIQQIHVPKPCQLIKDDIKELLKTKNNSDVIFEVDGKEFAAHKLILKTRSPVFAAMFEHDMVENTTNRVKIVDISESTFDLLLHFIYTDEIKKQLDVETGLDLLQAASKYQLNGLQNLCEIQLFKLITMNNAEGIRATAKAHNLTNFVTSIEVFIKSHSK